MLRFKKLSAGRYCILEDNRVALFDKTGKCLDDNLSVTPEYLNGSIVVNYISIVSSGKRLEVAILKDGLMTKYLSSMQPQDCVMKASLTLSFICFLRRNGKESDVNYNQVIFVCADNVSFDSIVTDLQLTKLD